MGLKCHVAESNLPAVVRKYGAPRVVEVASQNVPGMCVVQYTDGSASRTCSIDRQLRAHEQVTLEASMRRRVSLLDASCALDDWLLDNGFEESKAIDGILVGLRPAPRQARSLNRCAA